jgi:hypothetical protein
LSALVFVAQSPYPYPVRQNVVEPKVRNSRKVMWRYQVGLTLFFLSVCSLFAGGRKDGGAPVSAEAEISVRAAIGRLEGAMPLFEGDGGKDIRLAVPEPEGQGLSAEEAYLPVYVQGLLNSNFGKYSAIALIDRQNLNRILSEQDITLSGRFSDEDFVSISDLTNAQYLLVGILQKMRGGGGVVRHTVGCNGLQDRCAPGDLYGEWNRVPA